MNKTKILITGIGGDVGQGAVKCLKDTAYRSSIIGCDSDLYAGYKNEVNKFFHAPLAIDAEKYSAFLKRMISEEGITHIIPTTEKEIDFFDSNRAFFKDAGISLIINDAEIIRRFTDKYETINFLRDCGISYPATYPADAFKGQLGFPVILKPRKGCGSRGLFVIHNKEELDFYIKKHKDSIVQEYIGTADEEYTIGLFSDSKNIRSIAFRRYLGFGSATKFAELINDEKILILARRIAVSLDLKGSINIQVRKRQSDYLPFEINPRISSTVYMRHHFGFQDLRWWLDLSMGIYSDYKPRYTKGIAVRTLTEVFFDTE